MATKQMYWKDVLQGGGLGALDGISSSGLITDDSCITITANGVYHHQYDTTSPAAESAPDIIEPDDIGVEPGRWLLRRIYGIPKITISEDEPAQKINGDVWVDIS